MQTLKVVQLGANLKWEQIWDRFWILTFLAAASVTAVGCATLLVGAVDNLLNAQMTAVTALTVEAAFTAIPGAMFLGAATLLLDLASCRARPAAVTPPR